jgi:putative restriction endonuclease
MTNHAERVYRAWNILTEIAKQQTSITYKQLSDLLGIHHRTVRFILGPIQAYCLAEHLPALTILVINQQGKLGSGFIALGPERFDEGLREVYAEQWQTHPNPFEFASDGTEYKALLNELLARPHDTEDIYRRVKVRGTGQIIFRDLLLRAYGKRCCFSDLCITEGLEAVHIVPWSSCEKKDRLNVTNGLLLSSLHHRLFDAGWLTLTPDRRIVFCPPKRAQQNVPDFQRAVTTALHLKSMRLPRNIAHYPSPEFIATHNRMLQLSRFLPGGA